MLKLDLRVSEDTTPALHHLMETLEDRGELNSRLAANAEVLTRRHILENAAPSRHKTAQRLGASPTGYLTRRGNAIESQATEDGAVVTLGGEAEIFARVDGPVTIRPRKKWLTIPDSAEAYGRRAREFSTLKFIPFGAAKAALAEVTATVKPGKRGPVKAQQLKIHYWLSKGVTLPQDRGLLPSEEQYLDAGEEAARSVIEEILGEEDNPL